MKICLSKSDYDLFTTLLVNKDYNIQVAELFNSLCIEMDDSLSSFFKFHTDELSDKFIAETILKYVDCDNPEKLKPFIMNSLHLEDESKYLNNPYYQLVKPLKIVNNDGVKLTTLHYDPYSLFPLDEIDVIDGYKEISHIGMFKNRYPYLALLDYGSIWMCITPNEINTMQPYIDKAHGKVFMGGLGLGYFAFMVSSKDNVSEVTIVEEDSRIIAIFKNNILPHFPHKEKIKIIHAEGIDYLSKTDMSIYDFVFFDIWHNPNDGLPVYIAIKPLEQFKYHYWLEKGILALLRRYMLTLLEEQLDGLDGSHYQSNDNDDDRIINYLYHKTKKLNITSYQQIVDLLSDESLEKLVKEN